jgi:hypothetical protein
VSARASARRRRPSVRRIRWWRLVGVGVILGLVPVGYSYVSTVTRPSSVPLGVRSVEWVRANGGAWLVDDVERIYYTWRAPKKGGPQLTALPRVGTPGGRVTRTGAARRSRPVPRVYRPPRVRPLLQPVLRGEGVWVGTGQSVRGRPGVFVTTYRPDRDYPRIVAYVAWIDHSRTQTALYPGRYQPPQGSPRGPMEIPQDQRWRLLATFNSGFTYSDGHGGFAVDGHTYTPLARGMATLVGYRDGRVDVAAWRGGASPGRKVAFARQNLPLIVSRGRLNAALDDSSRWGQTLGNAVRVWRTGVGIDRRGNLVYVAADYQTVVSLARILVHLGAVRAMELDINPEWPSFITYGARGARVPSKLVPNTMQSEQRYLRPDDRDFFAVYRRVGHGPALVPLR